MTETTDYVYCGYIKAKFTLDPRLSLASHASYVWANSITRPRVTDHFIYVALGHKDIRDNEHARAVLKAIAELDGKVTRLDFCIDYEGALDFDAYYTLMDDGTKPKPRQLRSPDGMTVYIGDRRSQRMLRVYNKEAEILAKSGVAIGYSLTRIEIEIKRGMIARYYAMFMAGNTLTILSDIQELYSLRGFCKRYKAARPIEQRTKDTSCFDFVKRYRRIISNAYNSDRAQFFDILGEK